MKKIFTLIISALMVQMCHASRDKPEEIDDSSSISVPAVSADIVVKEEAVDALQAMAQSLTKPRATASAVTLMKAEDRQAQSSSSSAAASSLSSAAPMPPVEDGRALHAKIKKVLEVADLFKSGASGFVQNTQLAELLFNQILQHRQASGLETTKARGGLYDLQRQSSALSSLLAMPSFAVATSSTAAQQEPAASFSSFASPGLPALLPFDSASLHSGVNTLRNRAEPALNEVEGADRSVAASSSMPSAAASVSSESVQHQPAPPPLIAKGVTPESLQQKYDRIECSLHKAGVEAGCGHFGTARAIYGSVKHNHFATVEQRARAKFEIAKIDGVPYHIYSGHRYGGQVEGLGQDRQVTQDMQPAAAMSSIAQTSPEQVAKEALNKGIYAFNAKDHKQAIRFLTQANRVDAPLSIQRRAQMLLGEIYTERNGPGHENQNFVTAEIFLKEAIKPGGRIIDQRRSQYLLGSIYFHGWWDIIARNKVEALLLLKEAIKDGADPDIRTLAQALLDKIHHPDMPALERGPEVSMQQESAAAASSSAQISPYANPGLPARLPTEDTQPAVVAPSSSAIDISGDEKVAPPSPRVKRERIEENQDAEQEDEQEQEEDQPAAKKAKK